MRLSAVPALLVTCLALAGCASASGPDELAAGVATQEKTGSVDLPAAPVPSVGVGKTSRLGAPQVPQQQTLPQQQDIAWNGAMPAPQAFVRETTVGMPLPAERPVAMLVPDQPALETIPRRGRMQIYSRQFRDAKPINFGRVSPRSYPVHGVDVSRWQGDIDWAKLRTQGANFAYIKATDGGDHLDPMFRTNWRRAKEAGIRRGAYHFFYWCRTAGEQADWFIRNVPRDPDALPPVIDVEWNGESSCKAKLSRARVLEKMQVFMDKLERYYGQRPIIYTAPDFYEDNLSGELLNYPFWLRAVAQHPSKVYPGRRWLFWQYSGSGLSHGVDGKIDLNVFHGSEEQWQNWASPRTTIALN
ncbi:glycoside hydrolase family 25 protein [Neorhizobium galegae]|uniref:glycoside hydrolase family 25 protein n=1 Tax=Neorhizobium galegae TaxID=399 RepID=UPI000627D124|nr:GH25 family lysozyme [Neorhizobium galegae]KAB1122852.1 glycoside hydrolase family 25 protein [Neorhizobium galegae]MCQ1807700.1 glycoside hydrolase family 25 protein [Neorhizobium galegae]